MAHYRIWYKNRDGEKTEIIESTDILVTALEYKQKGYKIKWDEIDGPDPETEIYVSGSSHG